MSLYWKGGDLHTEIGEHVGGGTSREDERQCQGDMSASQGMPSLTATCQSDVCVSIPSFHRYDEEHCREQPMGRTEVNRSQSHCFWALGEAEKQHRAWRVRDAQLMVVRVGMGSLTTGYDSALVTSCFQPCLLHQLPKQWQQLRTRHPTHGPVVDILYSNYNMTPLAPLVAIS